MTTTTNTLYLIRHGENPANLTKEFSYKLVDYSLNSKGRLQAEQTAHFFSDKHIDEIYSSPLKRAKETADIIAARLHLPVTVMEQFREINIGDLEGRPPTKENWAIHNSVIADWFRGHGEASFPGGENFLTALERARDGVRQIIDGKDNQHVIVTGHGGIFTIAVIGICQNLDTMEWRTENRNCSITEITVTQNDDQFTGSLTCWASHTHMSGEATDFVIGYMDTRS